MSTPYIEQYPLASREILNTPIVAIKRLRVAGAGLLAYSFDGHSAWLASHIQLLTGGEFTPIFADPALCADFSMQLVDELSVELLASQLSPITGITRNNVAGGLVETLHGLAGGLAPVVRVRNGSNDGPPKVARVNVRPVYYRVDMIKSALRV